MKLIFLFTSYGAAPEGSNRFWNPYAETKNHFAVQKGGLPSEGYLYLLQRLYQERVFKDILIFIESARWPGRTMLGKLPCYVVPEIARVHGFLDEHDIIFARGGFRSWFNFLNDAKGKHWLMLYAANTGRARWRFWDVILDDLSGFSQFDKVGTGRFFYNFIKPISPEFFFPKELPKKYDICIGASHIHDRKGQWRTIKAIIEYERMYGKKLKCILPGKFMRGVNTNEIKYDVQKNNLDVEITGMMHRDRVAEIMNESKLFVYCGTGGQNDRGPLEALRCGTKIIVANTRRHHPLVYENKEVSTVINHNDFKGIAKEINRNLMAHKKEDRHIVSSYYETVAGMETVVVPRMVELLEVMKRFAHQPKAQHLKEHFLK